MLAVTALIISTLTTVGIITASPAAACAPGTCGDSLTMLRLSAEPRVYGRALTIYAIVADHSTACALPTDIGCTQPTGTVHFYSDDTLIASQPLLQCVPQPGVDQCLLSTNESETIPFAIKSLPGGDHTITAKYRRDDGSGDFNDSEQSADITITPESTTTTFAQPSPSPSNSGDTVAFSGTVTPSQAPDTANGVLPPSGDLAFTDDFNTAGEIASDGLSATGTAEATAILSSGTHHLRASYPGDFNYSASASVIRTHEVRKSEATNVLSQTVGATVFGEPFVLTATLAEVAPATNPPPRGDVQFARRVRDTEFVLGSSPANGFNPDVATLTIADLAVGSHGLEAHYLGGSAFNPASSNALTHTVNKASTTTVLSAPAGPFNLGDSVTFTAALAVNSPGVGTPTGAIQFTDGAAVLGAPVPLAGTGASLTTTALGGGSHSITATYVGDANFNASTSTPPLLRVVTCTTTITGTRSGTYNVPATGTTCISGANISGGVNIPAGAGVSIVNSTIGGAVNAPGNAGIIIITGNTIGGGITLTSSRAGVRLNANQVGGTTQVTGTSGGPTLIGGNAFNGALKCSGNSPAASNGGQPNSVGGTRSGECAGAF